MTDMRTEGADAYEIQLVLSQPTRARLFALLREADEPIATGELAAASAANNIHLFVCMLVVVLEGLGWSIVSSRANANQETPP